MVQRSTTQRGINRFKIVQVVDGGVPCSISYAQKNDSFLHIGVEKRSFEVLGPPLEDSQLDDPEVPDVI